MKKALAMDVQAEKLRLIEWLAGVNDQSVIEKLLAFRKRAEGDWWKELDPEEKSEIEEGLSQADKEEVVSHEEAMSRYRKWL
ncbi:hypothetical protein J0A68_10365 [Algoriphagus sp. H41]|uniref:Addiction module component n=1 Tax=Algoriphagus oliviformis TaxID=2811231 RepID=A0ABS3C436_9BACT|nr:hypothetical protein [Algoriphagus oliviformis]MBN7811364.1 hypothetical protein [Algoriphagus oliviformis]